MYPSNFSGKPILKVCVKVIGSYVQKKRECLPEKFDRNAFHLFRKIPHKKDLRFIQSRSAGEESYIVPGSPVTSCSQRICGSLSASLNTCLASSEQMEREVKRMAVSLSSHRSRIRPIFAKSSTKFKSRTLESLVMWWIASKHAKRERFRTPSSPSATRVPPAQLRRRLRRYSRRTILPDSISGTSSKILSSGILAVKFETCFYRSARVS